MYRSHALALPYRAQLAIAQIPDYFSHYNYKCGNIIILKTEFGTIMKATIFNIKRFAIHDGPGIRTTVFFKGCPLGCWWCHNPEGQNPEPELFLKDCVSEGGVRYRDEETIGREVSLEEIMEQIERERIFYDESEGGVTISGGEPLMQHEFLQALLDRCRERDIHTAIDTCGHAPAAVFDPVVDHTDLFLYDLKIIDNAQHEKYTGVSNEQIIENLQCLARKKKRTFIRFSIIPGITDTDRNIQDAARFASSLGNIEEVNLLPYFNYAGEKYKKLGRENRMSGIQPPSDDRMNEISEMFRSYKLKTRIGG
jgi:pyruvate formate lyase activating enzyme